MRTPAPSPSRPLAPRNLKLADDWKAREGLPDGGPSLSIGSMVRHLFSAILSLVALVSVLPVGASAQDDAAATPAATPGASAFAIAPEPQADPAVTAPGYFVYELAAGTEATGSVRLQNLSPEPVTIELAAVDAETAQAGGSAFAAADASPVAVGAWVLLDEPRVTLEPGGEASVGFSVQPPAGTRPGQYLAGLVAFVPAEPSGTPASGSTQAGAGITMQTRYVIGVQVNVPGDWASSLTITGASALEYPSGTQLGIEMRNDGDTFLQPSGSVTLSNAAATPILTEPIQLGTFITGTSMIYPIPWPGAPNPGDYGVSVQLAYADDLVASYSGMLNVSDTAPAAAPAPGEDAQPAVAPAPAPAPSPIQPWMIYAIGGMLLLIVILLALLVIRGSRRRSDW